MTNYEKLIAAFLIFSKYGEDEVMAEHDEIFTGPNPSVVSEEDIAALAKLGWNAWDTGNFHKYV